MSLGIEEEDESGDKEKEDQRSYLLKCRAE